MVHISLAVATYNEEQNIVECIRSCRGLVDEVIVIDGSSTDKTREIASKEGANVFKTDNPKMFHINKQKAIDAAAGEWILQLDADERVTPELADEIKKVTQMTNEEIEQYQNSLKEKELFKKHEQMACKQSGCRVERDPDSAHIAERRGALAGMKTRQASALHKHLYNAFFIPRLNYFLGGYLRYGGVYPDGVIRLIRKGKAYLPCKDVHELMQVEGNVGWLAHPLIHKDSPTFKRYLERNSRYIDHETANIKQLTANSKQLTQSRINILELKIAIQYVFVKPTVTFFLLFFRHKGFLDGWRGFVFAFFSAIRFSRAYIRYLSFKKT